MVWLIPVAGVGWLAAGEEGTAPAAVSTAGIKFGGETVRRRTKRAATSARVRRQYPAAEELSGCISAVRAEPAEMQRLFLRAAIKVMDADGEQHPAEFDTLLRMEQGILGR